MKIIKKNILGFIIGSIVFGSISVTIASQILATQVSYTNEKSKEGVTNVDGALTELYGLAEECQNASSSGSAIEYKGKDAIAVYLDPTGTQTNCSSSNFTSTTETKSGCMRFYVYAEDGKYKYAILDHNTTKKVDFYVAQSQVKEDTKNWNPNYQARNIRADEVYKITESTNNYIINYGTWQIKGGSYFYFNAKNEDNGKGYGWLFDRTKNCTSYGCMALDSSVTGYWTSDICSYLDLWSWVINFDGRLGNSNFNSPDYGVRPVIKISK